jgi:hypothetical protein
MAYKLLFPRVLQSNFSRRDLPARTRNGILSSRFRDIYFGSRKAASAPKARSSLIVANLAMICFCHAREDSIVGSKLLHRRASQCCALSKRRIVSRLLSKRELDAVLKMCERGILEWLAQDHIPHYGQATNEVQVNI